MTSIFLKLLNMSITASWLVIAVIVLRFVLKKAPRSIHCALWVLVAVRLVCPFSFESDLSLIPRHDQITAETFQTTEVSPSPQVDYKIVNHELPSGETISYGPVMTVNHTGGPFSVMLLPYLSGIWLAGMALLLIYAAESFLRIKHRVAPSIPIGNGVWICDHIDSPFIFGVIRPRIYLPSTLESRDADYVLAHERAHLKRKDHWWKPTGFILLAVYWFNPVLWAAYILLCRDIELACDEQVIKEMGMEEKKAYSTALLNCSLPRHIIAACPLAFGEVGVKKRIKNVLNYRKPAFWVILISVILCMVMAVGLLTDPTEMHLYEIDDSRNYSDLLQNTGDITLIREGAEFSVLDPEAVLAALDEITVREFTLNRSRSEDRDKTNRIRLRDKLFLNFSWDYTHVWIDNLVKPTYTYRVNNPGLVREIFETMAAEAAVSSPGSSTAVFWFCDPQDARYASPLEDSTISLPGAENITLSHSYEAHQISMNTESGSEVIITGWPIHIAAFTDLTGDGVAEVCTTVSEGFGMIDTRIRVYDCVEKKLYELEDRGVSNYVLSIRTNRLIVTQSEYSTGNVLDIGVLTLTDSGILTMLPLDNSFREEPSGVTNDNCSWDITALSGIDNDWDRYCYLVCYDFDSRFVSFFDPQITGTDLIVGVRYDEDQIGAAWFEKEDDRYCYRESFPFSDFSPAGDEDLWSATILTNENSYTVYLSEDASLDVVAKETERLQILMNGSLDNIRWDLPEEILAENYDYFDPQYYGNSLFLGARKGEKYRLLHFERGADGKYEYQDIYYFLPETIADNDVSLPVRRISTQNGELHIVLIQDQSVNGILHDSYIRLTRWPSILVLDPGEREKLSIRLLQEIPAVMDISRDGNGTPVFQETGQLADDTKYLYQSFVNYYDGFNLPGMFILTPDEISQLADLLKNLPAHSLAHCQQEVLDPLYVQLTLYFSSGRPYTGAEKLHLQHMKDHVLLTMYSSDKADQYYRIDNEALEAFLAGLCDASRRDARILLQKNNERITCTHDNVTIQLVPYWNWEYEVVEFTDS